MRAWEEFLLQQDQEIGKETVNKWLRSLKIVCFDACNLYLEARDSFQITWFEEHIRHKVKSTLKNNNQKAIRVHLTSLDKARPNHGDQRVHQESNAYFTKEYGKVDEKKTFGSFFITPETDLTVRVMQEFARTCEGDASLDFNPIYLFGASGSGKSHLMQAAVNELRQLQKKVLYVSASSFTEHLVSALRSGEMHRFRQFYRSADALFIENIEHFSGKSATQEEFFHTFNSLHTNGKLIVISSCHAPGNLPMMEDRLVSRFEWGITVAVYPLAKETLRNFLAAQVKNLPVRIHERAIDFLARELSSNIKALLKALDLLVERVRYSKLSQQLLYEDNLRFLLKDVLEVAGQVRLTHVGIIVSTAGYYKISQENILGRSQSREFVFPRQVAMYLCRQELGLSFMKIGEIFSRDHSTVISSIRHIQQKLDDGNKDLYHAVQGILKDASTAYKTLELFQ